MSKYGWIGAFIGMGVAWVVLKMDALVPGIIGGFIGGFIGEIVWYIHKKFE